MRPAASLAVALACVAACSDDLPRPELVVDLRILGVKSEPAEGRPGTTVYLRSLAVHPDPTEAIEQAWLACIAAGGTSASPDACLETATPLGSGPNVSYTLPEAAIVKIPEGSHGQVAIVLLAALQSRGGLAACMDAFEQQGAVPDFCRIALKRIRVLADADTPPNRNPTLSPLQFDGETVRVALQFGSIEETPDGLEQPFLSWFVTQGELEHYRTDGDDGFVNEWTPPEAAGPIWVVVRDGRGGEDWIMGERPQP
jgi:hypothetical protein